MNEKENTFNSIADRPLLVTSRWCKWGIHNWQKWSDVVLKKHSYNSRYFQTRYCDSCHIYDSRKVNEAVVED